LSDPKEKPFQGRSACFGRGSYKIKSKGNTHANSIPKHNRAVILSILPILFILLKSLRFKNPRHAHEDEGMAHAHNRAAILSILPVL
jgi:hypothetical protein